MTEEEKEDNAVFLVVKTGEGEYKNVSIKGNDPKMEKELEKITKKEENKQKEKESFIKKYILKYIPYFETLIIIISLVVFLFQEFIIKKSSEINVEDIFYIEKDKEVKTIMMYMHGILCLLYFFIMMKDGWYRFHSKTHIGVEEKTTIMGYVPKTIIIFWIWMIVFFGLLIYHLIEFMILLTGRNPFKDDNEEETNEEVTVSGD